MSDDTLRMLRDSAADFAVLDAERVRRLRATDPGFERAVWTQMADLGWLGVMIPEEYGGLDLGIAAAAIIAEQLGCAVFPEPYSASAIAATLALLQGDNAELKADLLPRLAAGERILCLAWQGEHGGIELARGAPELVSAGASQALRGSSRFVASTGADAYIVAARAPQGLELHLVERSAPGMRCSAEKRADGSLGAWLHFDTVAVSSATRVASAATAEAALACAVDHAILAASAELLGLMQAALELTLDYLRTRVQFGKPIGSFQALQHRAVDMYIQKELTRATVATAVAAMALPGISADRRRAAASSAKVRASQAALAICKEALQLHGAIGYTDEYDLGLYFNRALVLSAWLGNASAHRKRYAELVPPPC